MSSNKKESTEISTHSYWSFGRETRKLGRSCAYCSRYAGFCRKVVFRPQISSFYFAFNVQQQHWQPNTKIKCCLASKLYLI